MSNTLDHCEQDRAAATHGDDDHERDGNDHEESMDKAVLLRTSATTRAAGTRSRDGGREHHVAVRSDSDLHPAG